MIDEEITFREKGYRSADLSECSNKLVWRVCDGCGEEKWITFHACRDLCSVCANKKRRKYDYDDSEVVVRSIDEEKTFSERGYRSTDLSAKSHKDVWAVCVECGEGRWVVFRDYRDMCFLCSHRTDEYRTTRSNAQKGEKHNFYNKTHTKETKEKMRIAALGEKNHFYGKTHTEEARKKMRVLNRGENNGMYGKKHNKETIAKLRKAREVQFGENNPNWKGGISIEPYCALFNEPMKHVIRKYFNNMCFECGENVEQNNGRKMSVHHVNYQKGCGCDNTHFCIYVPLCNQCHGKTGGNRWYWYTRFMTELALRNPNYYAYHIPVVFYDEPSYNFEYVFEKNRKK